jgi:glycosyltransferase involved in cell wall biosynthesis
MDAADHAPSILHVFPSFAVGGAQVRFAALANEFGTAFRHSVVSLDGGQTCQERLNSRLTISFPDVHAPKSSTIANTWRFHRRLRAWRPDLLVTYNWGAIEFAMANLPRIARHMHVEDGFGPEERDQQIPRRVLTRRFVLRASTLVVPSRTLERIATETWRLPEARVRYIPNGIDLHRFTAHPRIANAVPVVGTVAALRPEKNVARLLRAFALATEAIPAHLVIAGDGSERPALEYLANTLGLAERITCAGHRADAAALYAGFDVFALTSDTEQMPLTLMEAMASGLPAVATDVGDVRLMLSPENAAFASPCDDQALAASLRRLLSDPPLRAGLGAANRAKAIQSFGQQAMFDAWRHLLDGDDVR